MILPQCPTPSTIKYSTNSFLWLSCVFAKPRLQAFFGAKVLLLFKVWQGYEKKKIAEANLRQRWDKLRQRWDQCKFLYIGGFGFFFFGQICFDFDSAKVKSEKKEGTKRNTVAKRKQRGFLLHFAGLRFWRRKSTIVYTWYKEFSMQSTSLSLFRFSCA